MNEHDHSGSFWSAIIQTALRGFIQFVPAIVISWTVVEVVAAQIPRAPWIAQAGLFIVCLDFYNAAAARASGLSTENPFWLAISRASSCIEPMLVIFLLFLFSTGCFFAVLFQNNLPINLFAIGMVTFVDLYVVARVWPLWGIPYFFEGKTRWSPAARGRVWYGPGLALAWKLTREHGLLNAHSVRFMIGFIMLTGAVFVLRVYFTWDFISDFILYVVGLPLLSLVNIAGTRDMLNTAGIERV